MEADNGVNVTDVRKEMKLSNKLYTPLKLFYIYILTTLFLSVFGPWKYVNYNTTYVVFYMIIFLSLFTFVYHHFVNVTKGLTLVISKKTIRKKRTNGIWVTKKALIIGLALISGMIIIKINEVGFPNINNIFSTMAEAYSRKIIVSSSLNLSAWLFGYFSIFYILSIILGSYYFNKLTKGYKIIFFGIIILSFVFHVAYVGNQKAIGDILIYLSSVFFAKYAQTGKRLNTKLLIISLLGCLLSFLFFSYILQSRMTFWNVEYYSIGGKAFLTMDHWLLNVFNNNIKLGVATFFYYLSSGYYGLSLALNLPFSWSYGYGSSFEMKYLLNKIYPLSDEFIAPYPVRTELKTGWAAYSNWHTIFPWLASDFTFFGALIVLCLFIAIYALSWNRVLRKGHWINIVMFSHLNILLLYVPANNQLFQTRASFLATALIMLVWVFNYNNEGDTNGT